jgi:cell wall-associated NlpC family hydrolase
MANREYFSSFDRNPMKDEPCRYTGPKEFCSRTLEEANARARVIAAAREWLGTKFHDRARIKGVGVDCAQLCAAVYFEAGVIPHIETGHYAIQHFMHSDREELAEFVGRYSHEVDEAHAGPGDVVLFKIHRAHAHAAIIVDWPKSIIHAHKLSGRVVETPAFYADLERWKKTRFFSVWG